jgi:hypothetical protein
MRDVMIITASLYLSMVPLHDNFAHQVKFIERARQVLTEIIDIDKTQPQQ